MTVYADMKQSLHFIAAITIIMPQLLVLLEDDIIMLCLLTSGLYHLSLHRNSYSAASFTILEKFVICASKFIFCRIFYDLRKIRKE